ncbi:hypothetical protein SPBR_02056 [Sporothrix brasiliensis 5110]|uniref:Uncharacterized protein n=1 Tax=Sporothrix brasiliensis 5110 TaxID=1398154 RepID=A0A0C2J263_9PEZI|nr:uncharacterized protein SPBR_02056 [Sporothrix brasiliensis 5110]KIH91157.1 hypothetical protein SPBR_02056 [Sporothrix brasiliensis 5110]
MRVCLLAVSLLATATPVLGGLARRYDYLEPNATSSAGVNGTAGSGGVANVNATTTGFPSTSTQYLTTTVTAISHPPGTLLSLISMITTRSETTYIPGPVTEYPATITETIVSTGTIEHRRTSSNGKSTTLHAKSTATWQVTLTVTDPNPPPPDTSDFSFPFFTPDPTDGGDGYVGPTDATDTATDTATVTPPPTATATTTA